MDNGPGFICDHSNSLVDNHICQKFSDHQFHFNEGHKVIEQPIILKGITSRFVNESKSFIDTSVSSGEPFFLMMSFVKVHSAHFPSDQFKGKSKHGLYGDSLMELDWGVGQILGHIENLNLSGETIIYFTSDNGGHLEDVNEEGLQEGGYNGVLRGGKSHGAMEGGIRVPTLISWPGHFPMGKVVNVPVSLMDLFPTILDIVNLPLPTHLDGKSLLPLLNEQRNTSPHKYLFHYCGTYLHGVTYFQDINHVWKVYFKTPRFKNDHEYKCHFVCQCFGDFVVSHDPAKVYNIATDRSEKSEVHPSSHVHLAIMKQVNAAVDDHQRSLTEVESQFSFKNSVWRPDLQLCCNFPFCFCREFQ